MIFVSYKVHFVKKPQGYLENGLVGIPLQAQEVFFIDGQPIIVESVKVNKIKVGRAIPSHGCQERDLLKKRSNAKVEC